MLVGHKLLSVQELVDGSWLDMDSKWLKIFSLLKNRDLLLEEAETYELEVEDHNLGVNTIRRNHLFCAMEHISM